MGTDPSYAREEVSLALTCLGVVATLEITNAVTAWQSTILLPVLAGLVAAMILHVRSRSLYRRHLDWKSRVCFNWALVFDSYIVVRAILLFSEVVYGLQ